jgi:Glycosyl hydrolases family 31
MATGPRAIPSKLSVVPVRLEQGARTVTLARGHVAVEVGLRPLSIGLVRRDGSLIRGLRLHSQHWRGGDKLIHLTEGVMLEEDRSEPADLCEAEIQRRDGAGVELSGELAGGQPFELHVSIPERDHLAIALHINCPLGYASGGDAPGSRPRGPEGSLRLGASWPAGPDERLTGLGARHGEGFDQRGRLVRLGADRRYTGPDCPPDMLETGGIPQGDCAPAPWLLSSAGWALWAETWGAGLELDLRDRLSVSQRAEAGPLRLHLLTDPTPAARLRHYLRLTGFPALLPEWAYGHWKSRDVYGHERDVLEDLEGYSEHSLPLDAIVIDSPWATQYNTWRFNSHQFPDPKRLVGRLRDAGVRTVVWVTPWVNLDSADGQRPADPASERLHTRPAANYAEGSWGGHFVRQADGRPWVGRWWMGTGSLVDFTSPTARRWWRRQARAVLALGIEGIKADDGEGYYLPPDARFADGRRGADAAWHYGELYRQTMQRALDDAHPSGGVLFGRSGWSGQQATGITWGGDQASDFWSLRTLVVATLTAAASGFSNWSHDVGGYLGRRLVERCPHELLLRWVQFGCFSPLMQAHGRFEQEAWRYDGRTLRAYRDYIVLHERLIPYIRAAAATAARSGLPITRPLCLADPSDPRAWTIADAYLFGPSLWVAPVLEEGGTERLVYVPRGQWLDYWTGKAVTGGRELSAPAPPDRIPVWVRAGSILVTYPGEHVASGLGYVDERERPLEATLWGRPRGGRAKARLADGTEVRWERGRWSIDPPDREASFRER